MSRPAASIEVVSNQALRDGLPPTHDELSPEKRSALLANPFLGGDEEPARLVAVVGGEVAGRLDLVAGELETPDGRLPCFWGSALGVAPAFRGQGLAEALLREAESYRAVAGVCAPSRMSLPLYRRLGYVDLPLARHVLLQRLGPLAQRWLGHGRFAATAAAGGNVAAGVIRRTLTARRRRAAAEQVAAFPPELEPQLLQGRRPFATHRPASWLDWVVGESFYGEEHRRALYLVVSVAGDPLGFFLVKRRRYSGVTRWQLDNLLLGSLIDWKIFEPEALRLEDLVLLALDLLGEVDAVEVCVPPGEHARLARLGFVPSGAQHVLLRRGDGGRLAGDPAEWTLRPGDGDHAFS